MSTSSSSALVPVSASVKGVVSSPTPHSTLTALKAVCQAELVARSCVRVHTHERARACCAGVCKQGRAGPRRSSARRVMCAHGTHVTPAVARRALPLQV
jgi:hypothetical protein